MEQPNIPEITICNTLNRTDTYVCTQTEHERELPSYQDFPHKLKRSRSPWICWCRSSGKMPSSHMCHPSLFPARHHNMLLHRRSGGDTSCCQIHRLQVWKGEGDEDGKQVLSRSTRAGEEEEHERARSCCVIFRQRELDVTQGRRPWCTGRREGPWQRRAAEDGPDSGDGEEEHTPALAHWIVSTHPDETQAVSVGCPPVTNMNVFVTGEQWCHSDETVSFSCFINTVSCHQNCLHSTHYLLLIKLTPARSPLAASDFRGHLASWLSAGPES